MSGTAGAGASSPLAASACSWEGQRTDLSLEALSLAGQFYAGPYPAFLQLAQEATGGQVSKGGDSTSGRHGAEGQLAEVRAQGELARGLLACWATLRKPNRIRHQEFPCALHPEAAP